MHLHLLLLRGAGNPALSTPDSHCATSAGIGRLTIESGRTLPCKVFWAARAAPAARLFTACRSGFWPKVRAKRVNETRTAVACDALFFSLPLPQSTSRPKAVDGGRLELAVRRPSGAAACLHGL